MSTHDTARSAASDGSPIEPNEICPLARIVDGTTIGGEVRGVKSLSTVDPLTAYEVVASEDHDPIAPTGQGHIEGGLELGPHGVVRHGCETKAMLFGGQNIGGIPMGDRDENRQPELSRMLCPHCGQLRPTVEGADNS